MTLALATQSASAAILARIGGIDRGHRQPRQLGFVGNRCANRAMLPARKATAQRHPACQFAVGLLYAQVLKDQYRIRGRPLDESIGNHAGKVIRATLAAARQPFEDAAHPMSVRPLCLLGRQLALHALRCLHRPRLRTFVALPLLKNSRPSASTATTALVSFKSMPTGTIPLGSGTSRVSATRP